MGAAEVPEELDDARLVALLAPWQLRSTTVGGELTVHGDRSRTWLIHDGGGKFAAKLTFDGPRYVEPGLRIAAAVDAAGICTGLPVRTADGDLCSAIPRTGGRPWTIALLSWVTGDPIVPSAAGMATAAGQLLGRVHRALLRAEELRPAGELLVFYRDQAVRLGGPVGARLGAAVDVVDLAVRRGQLQCGVLYGDPSPEILRDRTTGRLALIDWGTPSWGPLLFDLLTWERFVDEARPGGAAGDVRAGYLQVLPERAGELAAADLVAELIAAVRATWSA